MRGRNACLPPTQDEVVLCQLCISDLFVKSAAWVQIHICHEAAVVEFLLDLKSKKKEKRKLIPKITCPLLLRGMSNQKVFKFGGWG